LKKLKVPIIFSTKVVSTTKLSSGQTELTLSNGEKKIVDLYISTLGLIQNTEFVPQELLNEKKEVIVDEFLKVKGAEDIWAIGDASSAQANQLGYARKYSFQHLPSVTRLMW
jgi:NADH dehydrogenase FAD-containing subunit